MSKKNYIFNSFCDIISPLDFSPYSSVPGVMAAKLRGANVPCLQLSADVECSLNSLKEVLWPPSNMVGYMENVELCETLSTTNNEDKNSVETVMLQLSQNRLLQLALTGLLTTIKEIDHLGLRAIVERALKTPDGEIPSGRVFLLIGKNVLIQASTTRAERLGVASVFTFIAGEISANKSRIVHFSCLAVPDDTEELSLSEAQQRLTKVVAVAPVVQAINIGGFTRPRGTRGRGSRPETATALPATKTQLREADDEVVTPQLHDRHDSHVTHKHPSPLVSGVASSPYAAMRVANQEIRLLNGKTTRSSHISPKSSEMTHKKHPASAGAAPKVSDGSKGVFPSVDPMFATETPSQRCASAVAVSAVAASPHSTHAMCTVHKHVASKLSSSMRSLASPVSRTHEGEHGKLSSSRDYNLLLELVRRTDWEPCEPSIDGVTVQYVRVRYSRFPAYCIVTEMRCSLDTLHVELERNSTLRLIDASLIEYRVLGSDSPPNGPKISYRCFQKHGKMPCACDYIVQTVSRFLTRVEAEYEGLDGSLGEYYLRSTRSVESPDAVPGAPMSLENDTVRGEVLVDGICAISTTAGRCKVLYYVCIDPKGKTSITFMDIIVKQATQRLLNLRRLCMEQELIQLRKLGAIPIVDDPAFVRTILLLKCKDWKSERGSFDCPLHSTQVNYSSFRAYRAKCCIHASLETLQRVLTDIHYIKKYESSFDTVEEIDREDSVNEVMLHLKQHNDKMFVYPRDYVVARTYKVISEAQALEAGIITPGENVISVLLCTNRGIDAFCKKEKGFVRGYMYVKSYVCILRAKGDALVYQFRCIDPRGTVPSLAARGDGTMTCKELQNLKKLCEEQK